MDIRNVLQEFARRLEVVETRLDVIYDMYKNTSPANYHLDLPDNLRKSVNALQQLGNKGTASEVSVITKRARAVESGNLNQLVLLGKVVKKRRGRIVYFTLIR